jgi:LacI family transcriptional regulator
VVSNITNPFYPHVIESIVTAAEEAGYNAVLGNAQESPKRQLAFLHLLSEHQIDGAILTPRSRAAATTSSGSLATVPPWSW